MPARNQFREYPDVLDINQMCKLIGIGLTTGYKLIRSEAIPSKKIGRSYRILKTSVAQYMGVIAGAK
jgi:excisionase family DNA binding protein